MEAFRLETTLGTYLSGARLFLFFAPRFENIQKKSVFLIITARNSADQHQWGTLFGSTNAIKNNPKMSDPEEIEKSKYQTCT